MSSKTTDELANELGLNLQFQQTKTDCLITTLTEQQILILQTTTTNTTYNESNIPTYIWFVQCICNVLSKVHYIYIAQTIYK